METIEDWALLNNQNVYALPSQVIMVSGTINGVARLPQPKYFDWDEMVIVIDDDTSYKLGCMNNSYSDWYRKNRLTFSQTGFAISRGTSE